MDDVRAFELAQAKTIDGSKQIENLVFADRNAISLAAVGDIRGPDQTEITLVGVDEDHPAVVILKQIGLRSVPKLRHHDVAAFDKANPMARAQPGILTDDLFDPWTGRIHD